MSPALFLAVDAGTSSCRALVFDSSGRIHALAQRPIAVRFPQPGWVEQSAPEILTTQIQVIREAASQLGGSERIAGAAIVNQRETTVVWDRASLEPIGPAIVWQCRRTADAASALMENHGDAIRERTGLRPDAYFSGPKIAWLLDHVPHARDRAMRGELAAGTVDTWLLANLCHDAPHLTDRTNASRTMLWGLRSESWDTELCAWQDVPASMLAEVRPSAGDFGRIRAEIWGPRFQCSQSLATSRPRSTDMESRFPVRPSAPTEPVRRTGPCRNIGQRSARFAAHRISRRRRRARRRGIHGRVGGAVAPR